MIEALRALTLIDLRTTGLLRLGVSTHAARAKVQAQGRKLSQALHDQTDVDGLVVHRVSQARIASASMSGRRRRS